MGLQSYLVRSLGTAQESPQLEPIKRNERVQPMVAHACSPFTGVVALIIRQALHW